MRRRELVRKHAPAHMAAANPNAWDVKTYDAIVPAPVSGPTGPLNHYPMRQEVPRENHWETMQAFSAPAVAAPLHADTHYAPAPTTEPESKPRMPRWSPMKAPGGRTLTQWAPLDIAPGHQSADYFVPKPKRKVTGLFIVLTVIVLTGVVTALWLEKNNAARSNATLRSAAAATPELVIAKAIPAPTSETAPVLLAPPESFLTVEATVKQVESLLQALASASTKEARLACIASNSRQVQDHVEAFFKKMKSPIQIGLVRALPATVKPLPSPFPVTMCAVEATLPEGKVSALSRLIPDSDGTLKLEWNTLHDSLMKRLGNYASAPKEKPEWIMLGVRRNFGFAESAEIRDSHHAFDIQGTGDGSDHILAFAAKDQPIGRALDTTLGWNQLYLVRALVHWTLVDGHQRVTILDADLAPAITASP